MSIYKSLREPKIGAFRRYVVLEVLSDTTFPREKAKEWAETIENREFFVQTEGTEYESYLISPRNSVIGKLIAGGSGKLENNNSIMYPFFSSHFSLPVKPGEQVWGFQESNGKVFWVSRIREPDHVEDINYTHGDRKLLPTKQGVNELPDPNTVISLVPGFPNGVDIDNRETDLEDFDNVTLEQLDKKGINPDLFTLPKINSYETTVKETNFVNAIVYEPIPRLSKRPGDLTLQGSNNASIILGTERGYGSATRPDPKKSNVFPENDQASSTGLSEGMGAIDIVVGRGRVHNGSEANVDVPPADTRPRIIKNTRDSFETDKNPGLDNTKAPEGSAQSDAPEGDPDFLHDASRIYMSMKTDPDTLFGLSYPDQPEAGTVVAPTPESSAVIFKSDQVRIIARKDSDNGINGSIRIIKEGAGDADRATIVIQPDGSIMIDGPKIIIGDGREDADGQNGEGTQVILGRDATESILLGDKLITMIKALETKFNDHIHGSSAGNTTTHSVGGATENSAEDWDTAKSKIGKTK